MEGPCCEIQERPLSNQISLNMLISETDSEILKCRTIHACNYEVDLYSAHFSASSSTYQLIKINQNSMITTKSSEF